MNLKGMFDKSGQLKREAQSAISQSLRAEWPGIKDAYKTDPNWAMKAVLRAAYAALATTEKQMTEKAWKKMVENGHKLCNNISQRMTPQERKVAMKYTKSLPQFEGPVRFRPTFEVGNQAFVFGYPGTKYEADWQRWMLAKALIEMRTDV